MLSGKIVKEVKLLSDIHIYARCNMTDKEHQRQYGKNLAKRRYYFIFASSYKD